MNYRPAGLATSLGSGCLSVPGLSAAAFYLDITVGGGGAAGGQKGARALSPVYRVQPPPGWPGWVH